MATKIEVCYPLPRPERKKIRVAAYVRVSSNHLDQQMSLENQLRYFSEQLELCDDWEPVGIYQDKGISGLDAKKRDGFKRMIQDAKSGRIDLIVTKSISRFARNILDTIITVRELKAAGVAVYFEKERLNTMDEASELMLSILASMAQEESHSMSENIKWGIRRKMAQGQVNIPYHLFLGYQKGPDGRPEIVEREARIVRRIYNYFLSGKSPVEIAEILTAAGVPTPRKQLHWCADTVRNILRNEKYIGDALLQKTYHSDFLTGKRKVNKGQLKQYYVEHSHPAIIDKETFEEVQRELVRRKGFGSGGRSSSEWNRKIRCGNCGRFCSRKLWLCTKAGQRTYIWKCSHCKGMAIKEDEAGRLLEQAAQKWGENITPQGLESATLRENTKILFISLSGRKLTLKYHKNRKYRRAA